MFPFKRTKSKAADSGGKPVHTDHDAFAAHDPYAFEIAHKRLAWVTRLLAVGFVSSVGLNLVLGSTIGTLVPLQKLDLALIRVDAATGRMGKVDPIDRVRVLPITKDAPGYDLAQEAFVRRYTQLLLEIDAASQAVRMREANLYSDADWWKRFIDEVYPQVKKAGETGLNRSIVIDSSTKISERGGTSTYLVAFTQVDERNGQQTEPPKKLHAYVAVAARPHTVRESEKFENPLGLRVLDLSVKVRGN